MARARRNPIGLPVPEGTTLVRVGPYGQQTHIFHPKKGGVICQSGAGRAREPQDLYLVEPRGSRRAPVHRDGFATCYRCAKLAELNLAAGREIWQGPRDG